MVEREEGVAVAVGVLWGSGVDVGAEVAVAWRACAVAKLARSSWAFLWMVFLWALVVLAMVPLLH